MYPLPPRWRDFVKMTNNWSEILPGGQTVQRGLGDMREGRRTIFSCLVAIGQNRLRRAGLLDREPTIPEPERQLYRLLRAEGGDAYSRYNSLLRELASFEQALDRIATAGSDPLQ